MKQDNEAKHTANKNFFKKERTKGLQWPNVSPDLNLLIMLLWNLAELCVLTLNELK